MKAIALPALFAAAALSGLVCLPLAATPEAGACGSYTPFCCPVVGLGKEFQEDGCPSGYCGRKPNPKVTVDYRGGKVQFCCKGCVAKFQKEPAKYATAANLQLVTTRQARQTKCPMCGVENSPGNLLLMVAGRPVRFCSPGCRDRVMKAKPAERLQLVFGDASFTRGFTVTMTSQPKTGAATTTTPAAACCCEQEITCDCGGATQPVLSTSGRPR